MLVRRFGFATDHEEFVVGVAFVGTVIRDRAGTILGTVSCTLPQPRADTEHFATVKKAVLKCANGLFEKTGNPMLNSI
jgi:DNA-binding IclR family transcriptional regulator